MTIDKVHSINVFRVISEILSVVIMRLNKPTNRLYIYTFLRDNLSDKRTYWSFFIMTNLNLIIYLEIFP